MIARRAQRLWQAVPPGLLPFADAAEGLPTGRLLRLALVQVSVGMALTLLNGTLNRVMIVELGVPAGLVSAMVALPMLAAPVRALIGHKSDTHRSAFGWRRVPFIWMGTLTQFGGLALVPMSLMLMGGGAGPHGAAMGTAGALLAFLLTGLGLHAAQTAGLALACDMAPEERRPRVVALMYVALLVAMILSSSVFGLALAEFTPRRLFGVVGGAAIATVAFNVVALWKQEARSIPSPPQEEEASLLVAWRALDRGGAARRLLVGVALTTAAFNMQDVLLEPYGGQILHLGVAATTMLTAIWAVGSLVGFWLAARRLRAGVDAPMLAAQGVLIGLPAFACVVMSGALGSPTLFRLGALLIGLGGGLASIALLHAATALASRGRFGFAIGAWGATQATSAGLAVLAGGGIRDLIVATGWGAGVMGAAAPYIAVYHLELFLLFAALVAIGPLVSRSRDRERQAFALTEFPA